MYEALQYVTSAPAFWHTMGVITATAIVVGAIIHNGDLKSLGKIILTLLTYGAFIFSVDAVRIYKVLTDSGITNHAQAYAGLITILFVTFFYLLGIAIGVITVKKAHLSIKPTLLSI